MRNPKTHLAPGDILRKYGTTRTVARVETNPRGTVPHGWTGAVATTIAGWRSWTKFDCEIIHQEPTP